MNSLTEKARVATIPFGSLEVEGLMFPDGTFGISLTQAWEIIECYGVNGSNGSKVARHKNELRNSKSFMGKDFQPVKEATELNSNKAYVLKLNEFEQFLAKADRAGHKGAQNFRDSLTGLSLTQLWSDAFGIKFEKEERVQYLENRLDHLKNFHTRLTKWWKLDGCTNGKDYAQRVMEFKEAIGLPRYVSVNDYDYATLAIINTKETRYDVYRECGLSHEEAINKI